MTKEPEQQLPRGMPDPWTPSREATIRTAFTGILSPSGVLSNRSFAARVIILVVAPFMLLFVGMMVKLSQDRVIMPVWSVLPVYLTPWAWLCAVLQRLRDAGKPLALALLGFLPLFAFALFLNASGDTLGTLWGISWLAQLGVIIWLIAVPTQLVLDDETVEAVPSLSVVEHGRQRVQSFGKRRRSTGATASYTEHASPESDPPQSDVRYMPDAQSGEHSADAQEEPAVGVTGADVSPFHTHDVASPGSTPLNSDRGPDLGKAVFLAAAVFVGAIIGISVGEETEERVGGAFLGALLGGLVGWAALRLSSRSDANAHDGQQSG